LIPEHSSTRRATFSSVSHRLNDTKVSFRYLEENLIWFENRNSCVS